MTRIRNLFGIILTWQIFQEEFHKEYLTETYRKEKVALFINLVQGPLSVREYVDKFKDLYKYARDIYPMEEVKSEKFHEGLHISLRGKLNLYAETIFRGWIEKAMEQEKLDKELEASTQIRSYQQA